MGERVFNRLKLGPIVGHTDETSARVWIQVFDDPRNYQLRVHGAGLFDFVSTEANWLEFRTAIATATGLRPDWIYRYSVVRRGRVVSRSRGSFRTMPDPGSMTPVVFCAISCSKASDEGLWKKLATFVKEVQPRFILMMGDQVYIDEDPPDIVEKHLQSPPAIRRLALAEKYASNWSRDPVREVMSTVPTYMMWDDHDVRDGWGSLASDSPTLVQRYPRGREVFDTCNAFFEDARDVYWHFQACHNPLHTPGETVPNIVEGPPLPGERRAMPYAFRCGRLLVLVLDSRGARDVFRPDLPVLGADQGAYIEQVFGSIPADVEALAIVTPTPIASMDPGGQTQRLLGDRTDDVVAFRRGDLNGVLNPVTKGKKDLPATIANVHLSRLFGAPLNLGRYQISNIDEARDQWSHRFARPEQQRLLRLAGTARLANATPGTARELIFLSGDIHVGCIYDIESRDPEFTAVSLTSSGVSAKESTSVVVGTFLDEKVPVASGVTSTLRDVVRDFNFGVVQVIPTGTGAQIVPSLAHEGHSTSFGIDLTDLLKPIPIPIPRPPGA